MVAKTIPYLGKIQLGLKTFTTTYPTKNGVWNFNPHTPGPMEFRGYLAAGTLQPIGLYCATIDLSTAAVYGTTAAGDNTNAREDTVDFAYGNWARDSGGLGRVRGWAFGPTLNPAPTIYDLPAIFGTNVVLPGWGFNVGVQFPIATNTGAYQPGCLPNNPKANGDLAMTGIKSLSPFVWAANGVAVTFGGAGGVAFDFGITNNFHTLQGLAYNGLSYVITNNPASNADRTQLATTDWEVTANIIKYQVTFTNPPGLTVGDIDDYLTQHGNCVRILPTFGPFFLIPSKDTITLDGVSYNGYAVMILPDYSGYFVLLFQPLDALASTWAAQVGEYEAKFDSTGAYWMKNVNSGTTLFVSAASVLKLLPVIPPLPLPDRQDLDPVMLMMKANP